MADDNRDNRLPTLHIVKNNDELDEISRFKENLTQIATMMDVKHNFSVGQLIKWKAGLKNTKFPQYGEPVIVRKVLDIPIKCSTVDTGSPYFCDQLNIIIGTIASDGDFLEFHADGRRYEPFEG